MTQKQTILPILALIASIAIMTIPSALAEETTQIEMILAEIAEHEELIAAMSADTIVLEQSISDGEDANSDFETAKTMYQLKVDTKSQKLDALNDRLATFANPHPVEDERAYNALQQTILDVEEEIAFAQEMLDMCVSNIATNDAIIHSAELQINQNVGISAVVEQRVASLYDVLNNPQRN